MDADCVNSRDRLDLESFFFSCVILEGESLYGVNNLFVQKEKKK